MQTIATFLIAALISVASASPDQVPNSVPVVENVGNNAQPVVHQPSQVVPSPEYVAQPGVVVGNDQPHVTIEHPVIGHYAPGPIPTEQFKPIIHPNEQYGQPESASIPSNYKPFGSWGLYIGGSPQDGYYTNYYKSLGSNSVDKVQSVGVPQSASYNPFAYSPSEFNSGVPVSAGPVYGQAPSVGSQFYSPSFLEQPDFYATKRHHQSNKPLPTASGVKGSSKSVTRASPVVVGQYNQNQQNGQVVAYSVPVGSQIVGSQPGVDGSFGPFGVHGFTRYAVKPALVNQGSYYQSVPVDQVVPYHKPQSQVAPQHQQVYSVVQPQVNSVSLYPLSYYGYPINQIYGYHHSSNQVAPVQTVGQTIPVASPVSPVLKEEVHQIPVVPVQQQSPVSPVQAGQQAGLIQASSLAHDQQQQQQQQQEQTLDKPDKNDGYATKQ